MPRTLATLEGLERPAWLALRRQGIGSSDVAGICGLDRYSSPLSVYLDKTGQAEEREETAQMRMGRKLEDVIASEFELETEIPTTKPTVMFQHRDVDHMLASPDRLIDAGVLELKTYTGRGDVWEDGPPPGVVLQVTHQLLVMEERLGYVALLEHGVNFRHWRIDLDDDVAARLVDLEGTFWDRVQRREPPPVDGHPATSAALQQLYRSVEPGERVELDVDTLIAWVRAKATAKAAEGEVKRLENLVKGSLGHAEIGTVGDVDAVTWKASAAFDEDRFRLEEPELAVAFSRIAVGEIKDARPDLYKKYQREGAGSRRLLPKKGIPA